MSPRPESLGELQQWMQASILPGGAIETEEAMRRLLPSATLAAEERLAIYRRAVAVRLEEALAALHPVVRAGLGGTAFARLADAYFRAHPSTSFTLAAVADHLPVFLATWTGLPTGVRAAFADVAAVEQARREVAGFRASEPIALADLQAVDPSAWDDAVLQPAPGLRLIRLEHDVAGAFRDREQDTPRRRRQRLAVFRGRRGAVHVHVPVAAERFFDALVDGVSLGSALARVAPSTAGRVAGRVAGWLRAWFAAGTFVSVEHGNPSCESRIQEATF